MMLEVTNNADVIDTQVNEQAELSKDTNFETGNYMIKIKDENGTLKEMLITNSNMTVTEMKTGGLIIDLK